MWDTGTTKTLMMVQYGKKRSGVGGVSELMATDRVGSII